MAIGFFLSGGASNADPAASLGGVISSTRVYSQALAFAGAGISGITLIDGAGNPANPGELAYTLGTGSITWKPYGSALPGPPVSLLGVSTDPIIVPADTNPYSPKGSIVISVVAGSLPGADASDNVTVSNLVENLFEEILTAEAEAGSTKYRGIYIKNMGGDPIYMAVAIAANSTAGDVISIGLEAAVGTMQTIANETTAPTGITFSSANRPVLDESLTLLDGEVIGLWIKRTVPALSVIGANPAISQIKAYSY